MHALTRSETMFITRPPRLLSSLSQLALLGLLGLGLGLPVDAAAAPPNSPGEPSSPDAANNEIVRIHIVVIGGKLSQQVLEDVTDQLDAQWAVLSERLAIREAPLAEAEAVLRVEFGQPNLEQPIYVVSASLRYGEQTLVRGKAETCVRCDAEDLVSRALTIVPEGAELLRTARAESRNPAVANAPSPEEDDAAAETGAAPLDRPKNTRLGILGYIAVPMFGLGLGGLVGGGVLLNKGVVLHDPPFLQTNYRQPGLAVGVAGLALVVVGTTLIAIDLAVLAPRGRARVGSSRGVTRVGVGSIGSPAGLTVSGQF